MAIYRSRQNFIGSALCASTTAALLQAQRFLNAGGWLEAVRAAHCMPYSKFRSATALIASLLWLGLNQPAAAITDAENEALMQQCTIYASRAQKAAKYVTGLGCYPDSGTTSTDYTAHYDFCYKGFINGTMDWDFLQWEDDKRSAMTRSCGYCTGANTPPGETPFGKASTDRLSNRNIYHCDNKNGRGGVDYSTPAWSDDPKERVKACLQIPLGDPGDKAAGGGRFMQIHPVNADAVEAGLEEAMEKSCPGMYGNPAAVRNTCWNFSMKARMIGNWVYNYEGDACFSGQPLDWWKNGSYYDWCTKVYDRVGSDINPLTLEQANSTIENEKETMEAVIDACQTRHQKPIIDDMGNECTPEAQAARTCVFTPTAQVTPAQMGVMGTRAYTPTPPTLSYETGGDISNLTPPRNTNRFILGGGGSDDIHPNTGQPPSGRPIGPRVTAFPGRGGPPGQQTNTPGSSGGGGPSSGGLSSVMGQPNIQPTPNAGPFRPPSTGGGPSTAMGQPGNASPPGSTPSGGSGTELGQPAANKPSSFVRTPVFPERGAGSGSSPLSQPAANKPSSFVHAPAFPGTGGQGTSQGPGVSRLSIASPPSSNGGANNNGANNNYRAHNSGPGQGSPAGRRNFIAYTHRNESDRARQASPRGYRGGGYRVGGHSSAHRSDIRLKHDVALLERLDNGLGLYRFSYNGSNEIFVGVMAQEVEAIVPEAVIHDKDGYLRVYYERLGLRLQTWQEWEADGQKIPNAIRSNR